DGISRPVPDRDGGTGRRVRRTAENRHAIEPNRRITRIGNVLGEVDLAVNVALLKIREQVSDPAPTRTQARTIQGRGLGREARREATIGTVVGVEGQPDLLEVVLALQPGRRFTHLLNGGEQEADQYADNGDHHEQFD